MRPLRRVCSRPQSLSSVVCRLASHREQSLIASPNTFVTCNRPKDPSDMSKKKIDIHELYANDPQKADELLWGRKSDPNSRRGFLKKAGLAAMSLAVGGKIVFAE